MKENSVFSFVKVNFLEKLLWFYIIFLPFMKVPLLPGLNYKLVYCDLIFVFLFFTWFFRLLKGQVRIKKVPAVFSVSAMLLIFFLSFIHSRMLIISGIDFVGIAYLIILYMMINQLVISQRQWWRLVICWVGVSFIISFTGVSAYTLWSLGVPNMPFMSKFDILGNVDPNLTYRLVSVFRHPGMFATYLHISIIFALILIKGLKNRWVNILGYLTVITCFIAAILTKARTSAGIALTIFLALIFFPKKNKIISIIKGVFSAYTLIAIVIVFSSIIWWILPIKFYKNAQDSKAGVEINLTLFPYFIHQKASFNMMKDNPLLGVGLGMYNYNSADYISWEEARGPFRMIRPDITEEQEDRYRKGIDPHSTYWGWGAEAGLTGLLVILWFFFQTGYILFKKIRKEVDITRKYIYGVMLAGMAGFWLNGFYIDVLTMRHFWFFIGMALVFTQFSEEHLN